MLSFIGLSSLSDSDINISSESRCAIPCPRAFAVTGARIVRDTFDLRPSVPLRSTQLRRADISADLR
jgi:hypothetical protein